MKSRDMLYLFRRKCNLRRGRGGAAGLTQRRLSFKFLRMTRVSVNTKTRRPVPPPHLCIVFLLSPAHSSYKNPKKDITNPLIPAFPCLAPNAPTKRSATSRRNSLALRRVRAAILWRGNTRIASPGAFGDIVSLRVFAKQKLSGLHSLCAASVRRFYGAGTLALLRPARFRLAKVFSSLATAHFRPAKVFSSLPRCVSGSQKLFHRLPRRVFGLQKFFRGLPSVFSDCESSFVASLGVFGDIVSLRVFAKQKLSGLHSLCAASVRRFYGAGTLASLARGARRHRAAIHSLCAASVRRFYRQFLKIIVHKEDFFYG